jgi:hypothetical protein
MEWLRCHGCSSRGDVTAIKKCVFAAQTYPATIAIELLHIRAAEVHAKRLFVTPVTSF